MTDIDPDNDGDPDDPTIVETHGVIIMGIITPNGDGLNDTWVIIGIENFRNNNVKIYNRWGNLVYEKDYYQNNWDGHSDGRLTIMESSKLLPVGVYYYIIDLGDGHEVIPGYLHLNR
jgi:gliding motility-associated-like protein